MENERRQIGEEINSDFNERSLLPQIQSFFLHPRQTGGQIRRSDLAVMFAGDLQSVWIPDVPASAVVDPAQVPISQQRD